jgi:hypothetical protein
MKHNGTLLNRVRSRPSSSRRDIRLSLAGDERLAAAA